MSAHEEAIESFECFGSRCAALVTGDGPTGSAREAARRARALMLEWHGRFSRFSATSELSRLNADPRETVPASALMIRLAQAILAAGRASGGLVDSTLVREISAAGYSSDLGEPLALRDALARAPHRRAAAPAAQQRWRAIAVDPTAGTITRPPGVMLDSGGIAKGLFGDVLAELLAGHASFALDCAGDLRLGGSQHASRAVRVQSPFDQSILHTFELREAGVATSGIGRRSWAGADGRPAHHLLDPSTGAPAFTGIAQATAIAPTASLAEVRAKAALLSGPRQAPSWLPDGGVIVLDDGSHHVFAPPARVALAALAGLRSPAGRDSGLLDSAAA